MGEGVREGVVGGSCVCTRGILGAEVALECVGIGDKSGTVMLLEEGGGDSSGEEQ